MHRALGTYGNPTMRYPRRITSVIAAMTILLAGCELTTETTSPTSLSSLANLLTGQLSSLSSGSGAGSDACSDFAWSVSQESATTYSGAFGATCTGGVTLDGTATGVLVGDELNVTVIGVALLEGGGSCPFTLTGTARLEGSNIRIDYTGTTCIGTISGTELLAQS